MGSVAVGGVMICSQAGVGAAIGVEITRRARDRNQRDPFDIEILHGERIKVKVGLTPSK